MNISYSKKSKLRLSQKFTSITFLIVALLLLTTIAVISKINEDPWLNGPTMVGG